MSQFTKVNGRDIIAYTLPELESDEAFTIAFFHLASPLILSLSSTLRTKIERSIEAVLALFPSSYVGDPYFTWEVNSDFDDTFTTNFSRNRLFLKIDCYFNFDEYINDICDKLTDENGDPPSIKEAVAHIFRSCIPDCTIECRHITFPSSLNTDDAPFVTAFLDDLAESVYTYDFHSSDELIGFFEDLANEGCRSCLDDFTVDELVTSSPSTLFHEDGTLVVPD